MIKAFIESSLEETSGLLYVCGKPGQGKTAVITSILDEFEERNLLIQRYNAMAFAYLKQFLTRIKNDFGSRGK